MTSDTGKTIFQPAFRYHLKSIVKGNVFYMIIEYATSARTDERNADKSVVNVLEEVHFLFDGNTGHPRHFAMESTVLRLLFFAGRYSVYKRTFSIHSEHLLMPCFTNLR